MNKLEEFFFCRPLTGQNSRVLRKERLIAVIEAVVFLALATLMVVYWNQIAKFLHHAVKEIAKPQIQYDLKIAEKVGILVGIYVGGTGAIFVGSRYVNRREKKSFHQSEL